MDAESRISIRTLESKGVFLKGQLWVMPNKFETKPIREEFENVCIKYMKNAKFKMAAFQLGGANKSQ